ncbi:PTS mannose transporter subunit IIC [Spirochaetia bacterium]|nr:PTS mannose transporter subunit IIC [Spirochaetia bacterium]
MKIILASHGSLAEAMLGVVHMIMGDEDDIEALCLDKFENPGAIAAAVQERITAAAGAPIILVSDIKGGSVFNHLLPLCVTPGVTLFSGMNLDLVLSLVNIMPKTTEAFEEVIGEATAGIVLFDKDFLDQMSRENDVDNL